MKTSLLSLLISLSILIGCKKGDTGEPGTNGTNGINGTNGTNGNANVQSKSFTITPGQWQTGSSTWYHCEVSIGEITQGIIDSGLVVVYMKQGSSQAAMPVTVLNAGGQTFSWYFSISPGQVSINVTSDANFTAPTINYDFRAVIASGHLKRKNPIGSQNLTSLDHL